MPTEVDYVRAILPDPPPATLYDRADVMAAVLTELDRRRVTGESPSRRRQRGPWTHRLMVVAAVVVILAAFFAPLPHVSLFNRLGAPARQPSPTSVPTTVPRRPFSGIKVIGGIESPVALVADGAHVWVVSASSAGNSVSELNASTGALIRVLSAPRYGFNEPDAIAVDRIHVWVANSAGNSVTELNASTGALVQVLSAPKYGFNDPDAVAVEGSRVWVVNNYGICHCTGTPWAVHGSSLTELNASTGALVQVLPRSNELTQPDAIAADGARIWVADEDGSVTELSASTGSPITVLSGARYEFSEPDAIAADGARIWVANSAGNSVTEINASTGALIKVFSAARYAFLNPDALAANGTRVWVLNGYDNYSNSVTELNASTGALTKVFSGQSYAFNNPDAIAADGAHVWVANAYGNSVTELRDQ